MIIMLSQAAQCFNREFFMPQPPAATVNLPPLFLSLHPYGCREAVPFLLAATDHPPISARDVASGRTPLPGVRALRVAGAFQPWHLLALPSTPVDLRASSDQHQLGPPRAAPRAP